MIDSTESTGFTEDFFAAFPGMPPISLLEAPSEIPTPNGGVMARPLQVILKKSSENSIFQQKPSGWWYTYPPEGYESQIGSSSQLLGNIKNIPNHQSAMVLRILQIPCPEKDVKKPPRFWVFPSRPSDIMGFGAPFGVIPFHTVGALGEKAGMRNGGFPTVIFG